MNLLDDEKFMGNNDDIIYYTLELENLYSKVLFGKGFVRCFAIDSDISFSNEIKWIIHNNNNLKDVGLRPIVVIDYKHLCKGDAYGCIENIIKNADKNPVVIIENVTLNPNYDPNKHDDPIYIENILLRLWKNKEIFINGFNLNRDDVSVLISCPTDDQTILGQVCKMCSYSWMGDFREWNKNTQELANKLAKQKHIE